MQLSIIGEGEENEDGRTYSRQKKDRCDEGNLGLGKIWPTKFGSFFDWDQHRLSHF